MRNTPPQKSNREEAIRLGLNKYTGKPCTSCGKSVRYVISRGCITCLQGKKSIWNNTIQSNGKTARANSLSRRYERAKKWFADNFFHRGCVYCKKVKPVIVMQIEHPIPVGGSHKISKNGIKYRSPQVRSSYIRAGTSIETVKKKIKKYGLVPSCADCNFVKSKTLDKGTPEGKREWRRYLREIRKTVRGHKNKNQTSGKGTSGRKSPGRRHGNIKPRSSHR